MNIYFIKVKTVYECVECGKQIEYIENIYSKSIDQILNEHSQEHYFTKDKEAQNEH